MDGSAFDELTRKLAGGLSRRRVLKGMFAGVGSSALAAVVATPRIHAQQEDPCEGFGEGYEPCGEECCVVCSEGLERCEGGEYCCFEGQCIGNFQCCGGVICNGECCAVCESCLDGACQVDPALNDTPNYCMDPLYVCCNGECVEGSCEAGGGGDDDDLGDDDDTSGEIEDIESLPNTGAGEPSDQAGWTSAAAAGAAVVGAAFLIREDKNREQPESTTE